MKITEFPKSFAGGGRVCRGKALVGAGARVLALLLVVLLVSSGLVVPARAATKRPGPPAPVVAGEIIVKYKPGIEGTARDKLLSAVGLSRAKRKGLLWADLAGRVPGLEVLKLPSGKDTAAAIKALKAQPGVAYVQPNYLYKPCFPAPNDPRFGEQWGLENPTTPNVDIGALQAWDYTTGAGDIVVAVLDEGVDPNHPELAANIWVNPADPLDGLDNDSNGLVDDTNGWDFFWNDNTVFEGGLTDLHGTHVAGVVAAAMNNSTGIAGVAPNVKIMPLKFMGPNGGSTSTAVQAINYAMAHGVRIINASWGSGAYDQALRDTIQAFGEAGGVFIAAAGNGDASGYGYDTDVTPFYPASYNLPNIISVAAVDSRGSLVRNSNTGKVTVDLGAPGSAILGPVPPQTPAAGPAALEVAGASGSKAVVWGFGAEMFTDSAARTDAIARAMTALGTPPVGRVLVVDDDESPGGPLDFQASYVDPLLSLGYDIMPVLVVAPDADGPSAATMAGYDAVVWFTGSSFGGEFDCLTAGDQTNLTAYLAGGAGRRLFLSGQDALWGIEETDFVRNVLCAWSLGEWLGPSLHLGLVGLGGSYAGANYAGWLGNNNEDFLAPWTSSARTVLFYPGGPYTDAYATLEGTSSAAPFVTGVVALLLSQRPSATTADVVQAITTTVTPLTVLRNVTVTGGMVNAPAALAAITRGVTVSPELLSLAEGGLAASYTVVLRGVPTGDVTITATPGPEVTLDNGQGGPTLTFTPGNWNIPQTMLVSAVDDAIVEGPHAGLIAHAATGGDYSGVTVSAVTANITDNDSPVVTVVESDGLTAVTEGGATDTYTVVLGLQPSADVTIIATPDSQLTVDNGRGGRTLVFTPANWNVPQTFTAAAVDDTAVEGPHAGSVAHSASGGGYNGATIAGVTASITDNDKPGLVVAESGGSTQVTEGGATDTYTLCLNGPPTGEVTVTADITDGQTTVSPVTHAFSFELADWNVPQTVTVTAVDDAVVDGLDTGTITYTAAGGGYVAGTPVGTVTVTITDNDAPGVSIIESGGATTITEGGVPDSYNVVLTSQPGPTVTVTIIATPGPQVTVNNGSGGQALAFTSGNWNVPQTFTVTAVDDTVVEGQHIGLIAHSASGGAYTGVAIATVSAVVTDNDLPEAAIVESGGHTDVTEGAVLGAAGYSDTYTVVLVRQPSDTVTLTAAADNQITVTSAAGTNKLTFTTANWNVPQSLTIKAVDDAIVEGTPPHPGVIAHTASGGGYTGATIAPVTANVTDNDLPAVTVTQSGGSTQVTEGGAIDTYTIVLGKQPSGTVTVTATAAATGWGDWPTKVLVDSGGGPAATASLTFTPTNWNTPQTVTVSAVDDNLIEGPHSTTISHAAGGGGYTGAPIASITAAVTDNDTAGVSVTPTGGTTDVTEGGATDTYAVVLTQLPAGTVTVTASTTTGKATLVTGAGIPGPTATLTFTTGNWNTPQVVTVAAVDDPMVEGLHTATVVHTAAGGGYDGVAIANVSINITDNDIPGVTVTETGGSTAVTEGGLTDTYQIVLNCQPSANVSLMAVTTGQATAAGPGGGNTLTFTTANWNVPQSFTVTAVNDLIVEGAHAATISHSATGGGYYGVGISSVSVAITDNDLPSLTLVETGGVTAVTEGAVSPAPGASDTYTAVLDLQPCGDVTLTVSAGPEVRVASGGGGPGASTSLTFTPANWNAPQMITVTAVDDETIEGLHPGAITHIAGGGAYAGAIIPAVTATVTDDDIPGVAIVESGGDTNLTEGVPPGVPGGRDTYTAVLTHVPNSPVTFTVTAGSEVRAAAGDFASGGGVFGASATLTFTQANWSLPQTITVEAVDDAIVQAAHTGTLTHSTTGGGYGDVTPLTWAPVVAHITDNDLPGVTVTPAGGGPLAVTEGAVAPAPGGAATYTVVLDLEPSGAVTVTATAGSELLVAAGDFSGGGGIFGPAADLTFLPTNWNVPQTFTVTAFDDTLVEGLHPGVVTHTAGGGAYDGVIIAPVSVLVADNDPPGVAISQTDGATAVTEGGNSDTYSVVLTGRPATDVTVTAEVSLAGQATVAGGIGPAGDSASLTFTTLTWDLPQIITVAAVDDLAIEDLHFVTIAHTAAGSGYDGVGIAGVGVAITDNDFPGVTITESGGSTDVTEGAVQGATGGADTYTVVLDRRPTGPVTFTAAADGQVLVAAGNFSGGGGVFGPAAILTFTPVDWNLTQTITVVAVNDEVVEGPHAGIISHTTSGGAYGEDLTPMTWAEVTAHITDNDPPGVTVAHSGGGPLVLTEGELAPAPGGDDTYTVVLDRQPCAPVTVTATAGSQVRVAAGDWSAGGGVFGPSAGLTFTPLDWSVPQIITVAAYDDAVAEGTHAGSVGHSASGGGYTGVIIAGMAATITDNDVPSVGLTETGGSTDVTEGAIGTTPGATDTYDVALSHQPTGTVTVALTTAGGRVTIAKSGGTPSASVTLTFTTVNWNLGQTITVRAVDDTVVEGSHAATVTQAASGGGYDGSTPTLLTVNITDNDLPGVTVTESGGLTRVTEGALPGTSGATDTYTVVLTRQPMATVTITAGAASQVTVAAGGGLPGPAVALTFTTTNWNTPQTITAAAVDDTVVEGLHTGTITHTATGGAYDGVIIRAVTATVTDNDVPGVTLTQTGGTTAVAEGAAPGSPGATDTYTAVLTNQPSGDVTITATPSAQVTVTGTGTAGGGTATLVFTPANWNLAQTFTVAAVNDLLIEGPHTGLISHAAAGGGYGGAAVGSITVAVTDDDPGLILAGGAGLTVQEGGPSDTYTLVLSTRPTSDVTITVTPDIQLIVECDGGGGGAPGLPGTVTFTPADWGLPQVVMVSAFKDDVSEGPHTGTVSQAASSSDPVYDDLTIPTLTVAITENSGPAGQAFDPRLDAILRFPAFGVTIYVPAGVVEIAPGVRARLTIEASPPPDADDLEDAWRGVGPWFALSLTVEGPSGTAEVHALGRPITIVVDLDPATVSGLQSEKIGLYVYRDGEDEGGGGVDGGGSGGAAGWTFVPSGYDPQTGLLVARLDHLSQFGVLVATRTFGDIGTHWARKDIEILAGREVIQGVAPHLFAPQNLVTRAQFCALLVRALGLPKETSGQTSFADVPEEAWYAVEVHTAFDAGLVQGLGPTSFGPDRPITRQELAVLISRALDSLELGVDLTSQDVTARLAVYSDAPVVAGWARDGVAQAITQGIIRGRTETTIAPTGTATRAEAAVMLKRFMDKSMDLPVVLIGLLQVSEVGGRHYELIVGGQPYDLIVDPTRIALLDDLQRDVGDDVVLVATLEVAPGTIYQHGVPAAVQMTLR